MNSLSSELYSWGTNWSIDSINDSLSNDQEGQPQDVHAILSRREYLLYDSLLSITNSPSVYEQEGSQTGLENNLISTQRFQSKRSLLYDVNNKIFDSIKDPLSTRNDSLSNNGVIQKDWSEKDVQQDYTWVFPSSEEVNSSSARQVRQEANALNSKGINQEKEHFSLPSYLLKQPSNLHIDNNSLTTDFTSKVSQLAKELGDAKQDLSEKISEINRKNDIISAQQARVNNFTIEESQLETQNQGLNDENKKLSAVNAQSSKQGNYASISFVLSGAFAVGASLTIPYLAVCVALAVAASISLIVGCCCLYKANTALNNVELGLKDKGANSVRV